jgi:hypothetical protein
MPLVDGLLNLAFLAAGGYDDIEEMTRLFFSLPKVHFWNGSPLL